MDASLICCIGFSLQYRSISFSILNIGNNAVEESNCSGVKSNPLGKL